MATLSVHGRTIGYSRAGGPGDPLVLLHDGWDDRTAWDTFLPLLGTGFEVVALDRPGHGESSARDGPAGGPGEARTVADLLESLGVYPAHVAAVGSGSAAAVGLALERPELVRSVLVHEPPFLALLSDEPDEGPTLAGVTGAIHEGQRRVRSHDPRGGAEAFLSVFGAPDETWARLPPTVQARWAANAPAWADEPDDGGLTPTVIAHLEEVGTPVMVTVGEHSPGFSRRLGEALVRRLGNGTISDLPGAGHLPHVFAEPTLTGTWASYLLDRVVPST